MKVMMLLAVIFCIRFFFQNKKIITVLTAIICVENTAVLTAIICIVH